MTIQSVIRVPAIASRKRGMKTMPSIGRRVHYLASGHDRDYLALLDDKGQEKGKAHGIYAFKGNRLTICWHEKGDTRPRDFTSDAPGVRFILLEHTAKKR